MPKVTTSITSTYPSIEMIMVIIIIIKVEGKVFLALN